MDPRIQARTCKRTTQRLLVDSFRSKPIKEGATLQHFNIKTPYSKMSSTATNIATAYNQAVFSNNQSQLQLTPDDITWNQDIFNEIMIRNQNTKNWTSKMIQIIKLTEAMAVLETKAEDLANNINSTTADLKAKTIIMGIHNRISIAEQFHEISETLHTTIHDILPQRFHTIQCDLIQELSYCQGNNNPQVDQYINRVQESFANTNCFARPPMIPRTGKQDNDDVIMMPPTAPNSPILIPPPITRTEESSSSNTSQQRTMIKIESSTLQQDDDLQFEMDHLAQYLKTQKTPPCTICFRPPTYFRMVQDNKELSGKYWHDMVERLIETHGNTEIKRCGYMIKMYGGGLSHEPFFIGKRADGGYVIGATKKAVVIQALGEENISD